MDLSFLPAVPACFDRINKDNTTETIATMLNTDEFWQPLQRVLNVAKRLCLGEPTTDHILTLPKKKGHRRIICIFLYQTTGWSTLILDPLICACLFGYYFASLQQHEDEEETMTILASAKSQPAQKIVIANLFHATKVVTKIQKHPVYAHFAEWMTEALDLNNAKKNLQQQWRSFVIIFLLDRLLPCLCLAGLMEVVFHTTIEMDSKVIPIPCRPFSYDEKKTTSGNSPDGELD